MMKNAMAAARVVEESEATADFTARDVSQLSEVNEASYVNEASHVSQSSDASDVSEASEASEERSVLSELITSTERTQGEEIAGSRESCDIEERLAVLSRASGPLRSAATSLAGRMVACRGWERLGYARIGDYARERLGQSGRTLTEWSRVERALRDRPRLEAALVSGELPWSKIRLLARFPPDGMQRSEAPATARGDDGEGPGDEKAEKKDKRGEQADEAKVGAEAVDDAEAAWIAHAARLSVRALAHTVRVVDRGAGDLSAAHETDEEGFSTEEREWVRVRGAPRMAFAWSHACRMSSKVAGERIPQAAALEWITAEVLSALPVAVGTVDAVETGDPAIDVRSVDATGEEQVVSGTHAGHIGNESTSVSTPLGLPTFVRSLVDGLDDADAFELDARLRRVVRLEQRLDSEIAPLLRRVVDDRHARRGRRGRRELRGRRSSDRSLAGYARERLGMSPRKARALVRLEKLSDSCPELRGAFREGHLSWVQAQILAPLLVLAVETSSGANWRAKWIEFARDVTVRRLEDVVSRALLTEEVNPEVASRDLEPSVSEDASSQPEDASPRSVDPKPKDAQPKDPPPNDPKRQMCARPTHAEKPFQVGIHTPRDVARLFRATLCAVRKLLEPPLGRLPDEGEAFETMIEHALSTWEAEDPSIRRARPNQRVFERDGWQCTVPGCSTRRNLQAHHIVFRSAGGDDRLANQTTLCAFHHHRGVHARRVGIRGSAPNRLRIELGLRPDQPPLVAYGAGERVMTPIP